MYFKIIFWYTWNFTIFMIKANVHTNERDVMFIFI